MGVQIDVHIPRPLLTLALVGGAVFFLWGPQGGGQHVADIFGGVVSDEEMVQAEEDVDHLREERAVLEKRVKILQAQAALLDAEIEKQDGVASEQQVKALEKARREIVALMDDQTRAERELKDTLRAIWEAEGVASAASLRNKDGTAPEFAWPVDPDLGVSAFFHDESYEEAIGLVHNAIDIPIDQGSAVHAAADGTVTRVADNGLGYSYIVIEHEGGLATVYGHVSYFYIEEGESVREGQVIALSGGTPGMEGTGRISTGPHLHFEMHKDGTAVDPLPYLPRYAGVPGSGAGPVH